MLLQELIPTLTLTHHSWTRLLLYRWDPRASWPLSILPRVNEKISSYRLGHSWSSVERRVMSGATKFRSAKLIKYVFSMLRELASITPSSDLCTAFSHYCIVSRISHHFETNFQLQVEGIRGFVKRGLRVSITFRRANKALRCSCPYQDCCDDQLQRKEGEKDDALSDANYIPSLLKTKDVWTI